MKLFILLVLFSGSLVAQDFVFDKEKGRAIPSFIGQVKLFKGESFVTRKGGQKEKIKHGDRFNVNDVVETSEKAIVKILMIDETTITVGPKSEFAFSEFEFVDKEDRESLFTLVRGQLTSEVRNKAKKEGALRYRTKGAIMGVRGTKLMINFRTQDTKEISQFALAEGKALVEESTSKPKHDLIKGDHLVVISDSSSASVANDKFVLSEEEIDKLLGKGLDLEKDFLPLLPYFQLANLSKTSPLFLFKDKVIVEEQQERKEEPRMRLEKKNKSWEQNLDTLNKQLKENRKP